MKTKLIIFLIILSILITNVNASVNTTKAYSWLTSQTTTGNYGDIEKTAFAILALQYLQPSSYKDQAISYLESQKHSQDCWPSPSCSTGADIASIKSTSLALKALADNNKILSSTWLTSHQASQLSGNWLLQIITSGTGSCTITYSKNDREFVKSIYVNKGYFQNCGNTTWLNLDGSCLETNLIKNNPSLPLHIGCNMTVSRMTITYSYSNTYFPSVYQAAGNVADFKIDNGCFGTSTSCDYFSTLYANWALKRLNSNINSLFWLKYGSSYEDKTSYNALLYLITNDASYLNKIKAAQQVFPSSSGNYGYWSSESNPLLSDVYVTSLALLALKGTSSTDYTQKAEIWLTRKQSADGSFNSNVIDTSLALYSLNAPTAFPVCQENWTCTQWNPLSCDFTSNQARTCTDSSACGTIFSKPEETRACQCVENWTCNNWSSCFNNYQTRTCTDTTSCGTIISKPTTNQSCSCTENWQYTNWTPQTCTYTNLQTRTATDLNNCGTTINQESLNRTCQCVENWQYTNWTPQTCTYTNMQTRTAADINDCRTMLTRESLNRTCQCVENWQCSEWSPLPCTYSLTQNKTCIDIADCRTTLNRPDLTRSCQCIENWTCVPWSTCLNNEQTRTCTDTIACGTTTSRPDLTRTCATKTCSQLNGDICTPSQNCPGDWLSATNTDLCCSADCTGANQTCSDIDGYECANDETCPGTIKDVADTINCCDEQCETEEISSCGDDVCDKSTECSTCSDDCGIEDCCGNDYCDLILGEDVSSCSEDCTPCIVNDNCETSEGENSENCAQDCYCGNEQQEPNEDAITCPQDFPTPPSCDIGAVCYKGDCVGEYDSECKCTDLDCPPESAQEICDDKIDNDDDKLIDCKDSDCSTDPICEKKKPSFTPIIVTLIILILGLAGYFFYKKFRPGKPGAGHKRPPTEFRPFSSRLEKEKPQSYQKIISTPPRQAKTKVEDELERSIEEAKKILK